MHVVTYDQKSFSANTGSCDYMLATDCEEVRVYPPQSYYKTYVLECSKSFHVGFVVCRSEDATTRSICGLL